MTARHVSFSLRQANHRAAVGAAAIIAAALVAGVSTAASPVAPLKFVVFCAIVGMLLLAPSTVVLGVAWLTAGVRTFEFGSPRLTSQVLVVVAVGSCLRFFLGERDRTVSGKTYLITTCVLGLLVLRTTLDPDPVVAPLWLCNYIVAGALFAAISWSRPRHVGRLVGPGVLGVSVLVMVLVWRQRSTFFALWGSEALNKNVPILGHFNVGGAILAALLPLVWRQPLTPRLRLPVVLIGTVGLALTGSRAAWIAGIVGAGMLIAQGDEARRTRFARLCYVAGVLLCIFILLAPTRATPLTLAQKRFGQLSTSDYSGRLGIWSDSWRVVQTHKLIGTGPGSFTWALRREATHQDSLDYTSVTGARLHAHNTYLSIAAMFGLPLAAVVLAAMMWIVRRPFSDTSGVRIAAVALIVFGLFDDLMLFPMIAATTGLVLGLAAASQRASPSLPITDPET